MTFYELPWGSMTFYEFPRPDDMSSGVWTDVIDANYQMEISLARQSQE